MSENIKKCNICYEQVYKCLCFIGNYVEPPASKASRRLQIYINELSQCLLDPVKVSQFLYSKRCITEATLDKMETSSDRLDEKKITLLSAIHTEVSSDHKKLKMLGTVLFKFEETKMLSEKIISECG